MIIYSLAVTIDTKLLASFSKLAANVERGRQRRSMQWCVVIALRLKYGSNHQQPAPAIMNRDGVGDLSLILIPTLK